MLWRAYKALITHPTPSWETADPWKKKKKEDFEVFQHWLVMEWMNLKEKYKPLLLI